VVGECILIDVIEVEATSIVHIIFTTDFLFSETKIDIITLVRELIG